MSTLHTVAYRSGTELGSCNPATPTEPLANGLLRPGTTYRQFMYSSDGTTLAYVDAAGLTVVDVQTSQDLYHYAQKSIIEVSMSPRGSFVCTWERQARQEQGVPLHQNLVIHDVKRGEVLGRHGHKAQGSWMPQWTDDESMYGRLTSSAEVTFYVTSGANAGAAFKLRGATQIASYSLSPGANPHVVIFIPEGNQGAPAVVKMYSLGNFNVPIANKTFYKSDKVKFMWNRLGTGVLVLTSTDVDTTGQSYYGETNLYYMSTAGSWDCRVALDREGPIHDVAWAPSGREFAVTYGFIPSKSMLFNYKADATVDLGTAPRNTLSFSPNGRVLVVGGFGNLQGDADFWDLTKKTKLASVAATNATHLSWSPDGRYLLTATLSPRLRVDNGWKLWHYRGVCIAKHDVKELFQVQWTPSPSAAPVAEAWAKRELSPAPTGLVGAAAPKPKSVGGAYRPPSARLGAGGPRLPPGATPPPVSTFRNGGARGGRAAAAATGELLARSSTASPPATGAGTVLSDPGMEKLKQALIKKLHQIKALKVKRDAGEKLVHAQLAKIESEHAVRTELGQLGVNTI